MDDEEFSKSENYILEDTDEEITEDSTSSLSEEIKELKVEEIKTLKERIFLKALETETPHNMIVKVKKDLISLIEFQKNSSNIKENYKYFIQNDIRINPNDFLLGFYIANKKKRDDFLIENFNSFREISNNEEYLKKSIKSYKNSFEEKYRYYYNITLEKSKNYLELMKKLKDLEKLEDTEDILKTFTLSTSEVEYYITNSNYVLHEDLGKIVFDNLKATNFFPFIKYTGDKNYYKIYKKDIKYEYYINYIKDIEDSKNKIYLLMNAYDYKNRFSDQIVTIDLENSTINIQYPENYLNFIKDKIYEILPDLEFVKENEKNIKGSFEILFPNYDDFKIYYMTLFDNIMREFLFIREENSLRSLKENIKFYYIGTNIEKKNLNYSIFFNIKNVNIDTYLVEFKSKISKPEGIKEFIEILQKLIYHYNYEKDFKYLDIIKTPYTGINGSGIGGKIKEEKATESEKKKKKIDNLSKKEPNLFSKSSYVRNCPCPKQPIIIDKEDVKDWKNYEVKGEKGDVVLFPPKESEQSAKKNFYTCPDDLYRKVSFKENPDKTSNFPVVPCCSINKTNEHLYENYDKIIEGNYKFASEYRGKNFGTLKTFKLLFPERIGLVPDLITNILKPVIDYEIVREGIVKNNKSSYLHCVFKGIKNSKVLDKDFKEKERYNKFFTFVYYYNNKKTIEEKIQVIRYFRKKAIIGDKREALNFKLELLSQELYNYNFDEIESLIIDNNVFYDSKLFYKLTELYSNLNIFVFTFDKSTSETKIEIPNHEYYHNREIKKELGCLLILRHKISDSYDVYELIKRKDKKIEGIDNSYIFPNTVSSLMEKIINSGEIYNINSLSYNLEVRKNSINLINWNYILRDYEIVSQMINSSGRTFSITFKIDKKEEDFMTLFIKETFPLNVKKAERFHLTTKKKAIKLFGKKYIEGNGGLFYKINDYEKGVFIPCSDVGCDKEDKSLNSSSYNIILGLDKKDRYIEEVIKKKANATILKELLRWLYLSERLDFSEWWSRYVVLDNRLNKNIFEANVFKVEYILPEIKNSQEGIKYLNVFLPEIFNKKIYLYEELYDNMNLYLEYWTRSANLNIIESPRNLKYILRTKKDFKDYEFNTLLLDEEKYQFWKNNVEYEKRDYYKIEETDIDLEFPFIFNNKETGKFYFIKNNTEHLLENSIVISYFWKFFKTVQEIKEGQSLWRMLYLFSKRIDDMEEVGGWTFENLKDYVEELTSKKYLFTKNWEFFNLLDSLNIDFKLGKDYSYIIYSSKGDKIEVTEKYIFDQNSPPFEIYLYQDGGYASMLPVV